MDPYDNKDCPVMKTVRDRNINFFHRNNGIKESKLLDMEGNQIKCKECKAIRFKLYTKFGGNTYGKKDKLISSMPVKYNFICGCGRTLVFTEGTFKYAKAKYGCRASKCPMGKTKMDKGCLSCEFIFEKE